MTVEMMGVAIALLAWMFPTRVIRSQVLSIRERSYIEIARANGVGTPGVIFKEIMPNLMPWVVAAFVGSVAAAILAAVGLEAIGLGANNAQTLGVDIYWAQYYSAVGARPVVVVGAADPDDRVHLHGPVRDLGRDGPVREPAPAPD